MATAQPATEAERRADELFTEGRRLLEAGDAASACPKFEESQRLDPGLGTLLNLGDCYERTNRLASALTIFRAAEEQARSLGETKREAAAAARVRTLESTTSRLLIRLAPGPRPAGFALERDGVAVPPLDLGRPIAVDPGDIIIRATAPGHTPFERRVEVPATRAERAVEIPVLTPADDAVAPPPPQRTDPATPTPAASDPGRGRRRLGVITGSVGIAGIGTGIALGLVARGRYRDAGCDAGVCAPGADVAAAEDAIGLGTVGTVVGAVGVVAVATGAVLWLTAPGPRRMTLVPAAGTDHASLAIRGQF